MNGYKEFRMVERPGLVRYVVGLLVLIVKVKRSCGESACGKLTTETPEVEEGQTLKISFLPTSFSSIPQQLLRTNLGRRSKIVFDRSFNGSVQDAQETKKGRNYVYTITSISKAQTGAYFVYCDNSEYSEELWIILRNTSEVVVNGATASCGNLIPIKETNSRGSTIQLILYASPGVSNTEWFHSNKGVYYRLDKHKQGKYEEVTNGQVYILKISHSTLNDAGLYKVHCGNDIYTNEVRVVVVVSPPERPQLSPLQDFPHCYRCVMAKPASTVKMKCTSTDGSPPQHVNIYNDGQEIKKTTFQTSFAKLSYSFVASENFEWSTITCNISNDAATTPLSTSAMVYLYRRPSKPIFSNPTTQEGAESRISCSSHSGRPKPNITFIYDNKTEKFTNVERYFTDNKTYSVESVFTKTLTRKDNGKPLKCCVEHDTIDGKLNCKELKLNVSYPPYTAHLEEVARDTLPNGLTRILLVCRSDVSYPASDITWTGLTDIHRELQDLEKRDREFGGHQVSQHMAITVGRKNFGKTIKCGIMNSAFPDISLLKEFALNITYPPYVQIQEGFKLRVEVGRNVRLLCFVESNPASNVIWLSEDETKNVTHDWLTDQEYALYIHSAQTTDSGIYICRAVNDRGLAQRNISLIVIDSLVPEKGTNATWTIVGVTIALVVVCISVAVVIVVFKSRKKKGKKASASNSQRHEVKPDVYYSNIAENGTEDDHSSDIDRKHNSQKHEVEFEGYYSVIPENMAGLEHHSDSRREDISSQNENEYEDLRHMAGEQQYEQVRSDRM